MSMAFSVTEALIKHIKGLGYKASSRMPKEASYPYVTVERTGGGIADKVDHPFMAVQVWDETDERAEEAANALRISLILNRPPHGIHSIRVNSGPYPFYDEDTGKARYQIVLDIASQL